MPAMKPRLRKKLWPKIGFGSRHVLGNSFWWLFENFFLYILLEVASCLHWPYRKLEIVAKGTITSAKGGRISRPCWENFNGKSITLRLFSNPSGTEANTQKKYAPSAFTINATAPLNGVISTILTAYVPGSRRKIYVLCVKTLIMPDKGVL